MLNFVKNLQGQMALTTEFQRRYYTTVSHPELRFAHSGLSTF